MAIPLRLISFSLTLPALIACCAVSPDLSRPSILSQRNVIVWDSKTKTEHFIRQAAFETETEDFGFIVATPSLPKVSEVDTQILHTLAMLDPKIQTQLAEEARSGTQSKSAASAGSVNVLQVADAGAYTITTIESSSSAALEAWLKTNKYSVPTDIREWIDGYVSKRWLFSAFKFKTDRVRMMGKLPCLTFKTEEPFAPYRVPKSNRTKTESLDIYFISDEPYGGFVQDQSQDIDKWCSRIQGKHGAALNRYLNGVTQIPENWVASYMKADFPTAAPDDLVFRPVEKEVFDEPSFESEMLVIPVQYIAALAAAAGAGGIGWSLMRKRRA